MVKKILPLIAWLFFISSVSVGQALSTKIEKAFRSFESDARMKHGIASLTVINANTGQIVFSENGDMGMATASTLKTITSATAFSVLGPDFVYETQLQHDGKVDAHGKLIGNIYIKGSGDPTLGSHRYEQSKPEVLLARWIQAIDRAGIREIEGSIIGDDLLFGGNQAPSGWTWGDMGNYYGAGVSALNWRENAFKILLKPGGRVGDPVQFLGTQPDHSYLYFNNEVLTGKAGSGDGVYGYSAPYSHTILLQGTYGIDLKKEIELSTPDPAYDVALELQLALEKHGIKVHTPATTGYLVQRSGGNLEQKRIRLDTYQSPVLSDICYWFNHVSINLYGEALLKTVAFHAGDTVDSGEAAHWERDYWVKKLALEKGALRIRDGSGLSPENRVTTHAMAQILNSIKAYPWFGLFYEGLPTYNGMKMKSGTISGVLGYAGYQTASDGTPLVFSFLISNYAGSASSMRQSMWRALDVLK